jgi:hypothetical protein
MNRGADMTIQVKIFHYFLACLLIGSNISAALAEDHSCAETGETHIWISPLNPKAYGQVKIMAVSTDGPVSELLLIDSQGRRMSLQSRRRGGPPWSLITALEGFKKGDYRVVASRDGKLAACRLLSIGGPGMQDRARRGGLPPKPFILPGSKCCSVRRRNKTTASLPCSRCCATPSATFCTTISASTKTKTCR